MIIPPAPLDLEEILRQLRDPSRRPDAGRRVELCQSALQHLAPESNPEVWALLQFELANSLEQSPLGSRAQNMEHSIACYGRAQEVFTSDKHPEAWALIQNNLGIAYKRRILGDGAENVEKAIACYSAALAVPHLDLQLQGVIQVNLADSYNDRTLGTKQDNVAQSIRCANAALKIFTRQSAPREWAQALVQLARSHLGLRGLQRPEAIEQALGYCNEAAAVLTSSSEDWAALQSTLADVYLARLRGDPGENREHSLYFCTRALEFCTRQTSPQKWATLHHLLGNIYRSRAFRGASSDNIEQAIAHYQLAAEVFTREGFPENWAQLNRDLAAAHLKRSQGDRATNLEQALLRLHAALDVFTPHAFANDWAQVQSGLGDTFAALISGDRRGNLERALGHYKAAEEVFTKASIPENWARLQYACARALSIGMEEGPPGQTDQALGRYLAALETYESLQMTGDQRDVGIDLGKVAAASGSWELAYRGYTSALAAIEVYRREILTEESDSELVAQNDRAFWGAIVAAQKTGRLGALMEHVEAAKARRFLRSLGDKGYDWPSTLPAAWREEAASLSYQSWSLRQFLRLAQGDERIALLRDLEVAEHDLSALYGRMDAQAPDYVTLRRGRVPTFGEIAKFVTDLPASTVLLELYDLPECVLVLALRPGDPEPLVVECSLNQERLIDFLLSISEEIKCQPPSPDAPLPISWRQLSEKLLPPELDRVLEKADALLVLPSGLLNEVPIHALWWRGEPLIARCPVRYAPSVAVAMRARARMPAGEIPMAAFGYVDDPRHRSVFEGEAVLVAAAFGREATVGEHATPQAVAQAAPESRSLHLSCHGFFDLGEPMRSGLVLSGGVLTAAAVSTWQLPGSLVSLSACSTGRQRLTPGDELYGLARAFLYAGASSLVVSMWPVDAATTRELMQIFYRQVREGDDIAEALRSAMNAIRSRSPHPFYWASFYLLGEGRRLAHELSGQPHQRQSTVRQGRQ